MANRYGRRQRRRHREEISRLQVEASTRERENERTLIDFNRLHRMIRHWDAEIVDILGYKTAARVFPAQVDSYERRARVERSYDIAGAMRVSELSTASGLDYVECKMELMLRFAMRMSDEDAFNRRRLLMVKVEGGYDRVEPKAYYSFSEAMWEQVIKRQSEDRPDDHERRLERISADVADRILELLTRDLSRKKS